MQQSLHFVIYCAGIPFNGNNIEHSPQGLGGSESMAYYLALGLAKMGHQVDLFTSIPRDAEGVWNGVRYHSIGKPSRQQPLGNSFDDFARHVPHDVLIMQRLPMAFQHSFASKINLWWGHDLALPQDYEAMCQQKWNIDAFVVTSQFHRKQLSAVHKLPTDAIEVIENGVNLNLYGEASGNYVSRHQNGLMVYSSRPERGLKNLLKPQGIMEQLLTKAPQLRLVICNYDLVTGATKDFYDILRQRASKLPNVVWRGALSKIELAELMQKSWLWVYPATFEEVSCISAMEAQSAGLPALTTDCGALTETLASGGAVHIAQQSNDWEEQFSNQIVALHKDQELAHGLHIKALQRSFSYNIEQLSIKFQNLVEKCFRKRCRNPITLANHLATKGDLEGMHAVLQTTVEKHRDCFNPQPRLLDDESAVLPTELLQALHLELERLSPQSKVLLYDLGTAAQTLLEHKTTRLDVDIIEPHSTEEQRSATPLQQPARIDGNAAEPNPNLVEGEDYSVIIAQLRSTNPTELLNKINGYCAKDGTIYLLVPWQQRASQEVPLILEKNDLVKIFAQFSGLSINYVPLRSTLDEQPRGYHVLRYCAQHQSQAEAVNWWQKKHYHAPRQTLSACILYSKTPESLRRTLNSLQGIAQQIIIGIDAKHGNEADIDGLVKEFGAQTIRLASPLETGFSAARNTLVKAAWADWILWIDDDEELQWAQRIYNYLRPNTFNAHSLRQLHYSVEPAGVLKTDYPTRLFRNIGNIQFFGYVHEHPETELNKGLGEVIVLPDVAIVHNSYSTEKERRRRFWRNLPLMQRDRLKLPQRNLGKMLWMRDLTYLNRYDIEQNKASQIGQRADEIIRLWRELVHDGQTRLVLESLPFYSEAVQLIYPQPVNFEVQMSAEQSNIISSADNNKSVQGAFQTNHDIKTLVELLFTETTHRFAEVPKL